MSGQLDHLSGDQLRMAAEAIQHGVTLLRKEGFVRSATRLEMVAFALNAEVKKREEDGDES